MNKKGQMGDLGGLLMVFIAAIVGVTLFITVAQIVGTTTSTVAVANDSLGVVLNDSVIYLNKYQAISGVVIWNATSSVVADTEYTVENNVVYNGALAVRVTVDADDADDETGNEWFISGTAEPAGYISGAGRQMALLIPLMFALAIALIVLTPTIKNKLMG
jgi:uncharacterized membrane protein